MANIRDLMVLLYVLCLFPARPTRMIVNNSLTALNFVLINEQISVKIVYDRDLIFKFVFDIELISSMM